MKKSKKRIFILLIVLVLITLGIIILINLMNDTISEYTGNKKLDFIKNSIKANEFFEFEENNQKYILFKIIRGVYAPDSIKIKSARITNKKYYDDALYLRMNVKTSIKKGYVPNDVFIDGYSEDSRTFIIKVKPNFNILFVNDIQYSLLSDRIVVDDNKKYGYIDKYGNLIIPVEYNGLFEIGTIEIFDDVTRTYNRADFSNYFRAVKDNKQGVMDKQGNIIIDLKYDEIYPYRKDAFIVTKDSKTGIVNLKNELINGYSDGLYNKTFGEYLIFSKNENGKSKKGIFDKNLNIVIDPIYDNFTEFNFKKYNNFGDMNPKYFGGEDGITFSKDYLVVEQDGKTAIMDSNCNFVTSFTNLSVYDIREKYENELLAMLHKMD